MIDLEYLPHTLLPPAEPDRIRKLEGWWSRYLERRVKLPPAYVEHIAHFHGGVPGKACFRTPGGETRRVGGFFHLREKKDLPARGEPSWRPSWGSEWDLRLDYGVRTYLKSEYWAQRLQEHDESFDLLPIAGLCSPVPAGLPQETHVLDEEDDFDLLCLDYLDRKADPPVVVWKFAALWNEPPVIQPVAGGFVEFLAMLERCLLGSTRKSARDRFTGGPFPFPEFFTPVQAASSVNSVISGRQQKRRE